MDLRGIQITGQFCHLSIAENAEFHIGKRVIMEEFESICLESGANLTLDDYVYFNDHCTIRIHEKLEVGKNTMFGDGVRIFDHNHAYSNYHVERLSFKNAGIKIGANCWIGTNAVILKGVTIGDNTIIGAGCVIYKDVPANSLVVNKGELLVKERPQAKYHCAVFTLSDQIEQLEYLLTELPMVDFHIAAPCMASPYLHSFKQYPNFALYTCAYAEDLEDVLNRADIYLDINHNVECGAVVTDCIQRGKPVLAFRETAHGDYNEVSYFSSEHPEEMVSKIKELLSIR